MNRWDEQNILLSYNGVEVHQGRKKEVWWRYWVHGETSEVVGVGNSS